MTRKQNNTYICKHTEEGGVNQIYLQSIKQMCMMLQALLCHNCIELK